jgi:hypothetical protein
MLRNAIFGGPRRRRALLVLPVLATAAAAACSATEDTEEPSDSSTGSSAGGGGSSSSAGGNGAGGELIDPGTGGSGGSVIPNPCGTGCGDEELCDEDHLGFDDNCDGQVDEICDCGPGQAHFCFKGDSSYHGKPGCFDGTQKCTELGIWGECNGGVHATETCYASDNTLCHAISAIPFQFIDLKTGTGSFSANALPGTEIWKVSCPMGVDPCPSVSGVNPPDDFQALQSGQYTVTYTKTVSGGATESCEYPLFVGARGLRVELEWEHDLGDTGVDLDLHLHEPMNTQPWNFSGGAKQDCMYSNCVVGAFAGSNSAAPSWFDNSATAPDPVNWYLDPVLENNSCYFAPRGVGQEWKDLGLGCHSPRLDLDNISCDPTVTDVDADDFCAPENINIDFPPKQKWMRIGVHYYSNHGLSYAVHPRIKVYCDGQLAADLGEHGYFDPEAPVYFDPAFGSDDLSGNRIFWAVADVAFLEKDECSTVPCVVTPLYGDDALKTPLLTYTSNAESSVGPAYPPEP